LKYPAGTRDDQAEFCLLRALKLGISNDSLLEEIGDIYADRKPLTAIVCFDRATQVNTIRGELYQKYGNLMLMHKKDKKPRAIELLKKALELIEGDHNKSHIALVLQEALKEEGRHKEAEEVAQFIQTNTGTL
jgi:tetratricopeptide (TPR) repeat protein